MLTPDEKQTVASSTRILQIIIAALVVGPLAFVTFVLLQPAPEQPEQTMTVMAVGFAVLQIVMAVVMPQVVGAQQGKALVEGRPLTKGQVAPPDDVAGLLGSLQVRRIIAGAMLEGATFFNIVAYMQERHLYTLIATGVLIFGAMLLFPLRPFVEQWVERELRTIRELRGLQK